MRKGFISIQTKLVFVLIFSAAVALSMAMIATYLYISDSQKQAALNSISKTSKLMAENVKASVEFDDSKSAHSILNTLKFEEQINLAAIYSDGEAPFSVYQKSSDPQLQTDLQSSPLKVLTENEGEQLIFQPEQIVKIQPIVSDGDFLGNLMLIYSMDSILQARNELISVYLQVLIISLILIGLLALKLNKVFTNPILRLHQIMGSLKGKKQYNIAIDAHYNDEFQILFEGLSDMLSNIDQAQVKLKESEAYNRSLFQDSVRPMVIFDLEQGVIDCNPAAVDAYGFKTREDIIGKNLLDFSAPQQYDGSDAQEASQKRIEETLENGNIVFEWLHQRPDSTLWDSKVHMMTFHNKGNVIFQLTLEDISEQKRQEKIIEESRILIEENYRKINDSIRYASLIQNALIPEKGEISKFFNDIFTLWQPKDVVGGDIFFFHPLDEDRIILMVIDCTGHGVPGAFVTMLVKAVERQIINTIHRSNEEVSPAKILSIFNRSIKHLLKQEHSDSISNAGFDGGILYYNKRSKQLKFAGAETPLFIATDDNVQIIKGNRQSIGYKSSDTDYVFTDHTIAIKPDMKVYIATDGFTDQNGGEKGFPFGKRRFQKIIEANQNESMETQKRVFLEALHDYQGENDRNDDITLIGFKPN